MTHKALVPCLFFLFILSGCHEPCDGEDKIVKGTPTFPSHKKFVPYQLNDVVAFSDASGNQEVYTCTFQGVISDTATTSHIDNGELCTYTIHRFVHHVVLQTQDQIKTLDFGVHSNGGESDLYLSLNGNSSSHIAIADTCRNTSCIDSMAVNGKMYYKVLNLWHDSFYTVNDGLIQYRDKSGNIWKVVD